MTAMSSIGPLLQLAVPEQVKMLFPFIQKVGGARLHSVMTNVLDLLFKKLHHVENDL